MDITKTQEDFPLVPLTLLLILSFSLFHSLTHSLTNSRIEWSYSSRTKNISVTADLVFFNFLSRQEVTIKNKLNKMARSKSLVSNHTQMSNQLNQQKSYSSSYISPSVRLSMVMIVVILVNSLMIQAAFGQLTFSKSWVAGGGKRSSAPSGKHLLEIWSIFTFFLS